MVHSSRASLEDITNDFFDAMDTFDYWWAEARYDSSFAQSAKTFASLAQKRKGMHNQILKTGRPGTYKVSFKDYKMLAIKYIRILLANSTKAYHEIKTGGIPDLSRCLVISPKNKLLLEQMADLVEDETSGVPNDKVKKGNDDGVDALIAGSTPLARKHRLFIEATEARARKASAKLQPDRRPGVPPLAEEQAA